MRPNSWGFGSNGNPQEAVVQLEAFKAKYGKCYPEVVRSVAEKEDKMSAFYEFSQTMHRHMQTTNAIESPVKPCASAYRPD